MFFFDPADPGVPRKGGKPVQTEKGDAVCDLGTDAR